MRSRSSRLLYVLLALYAAVSLAYYVAGVAALYGEFFGGAHHSEAPFTPGDDGRTLETVRKPAAALGIVHGDVLVTLNGAPYTGVAQLNDFVRWHAPGTPIRFTVRTAKGELKTGELPLHRFEGPNFGIGGYIAFLLPVLFVPLLSLILGFWVVGARPRGPGGWV